MNETVEKSWETDWVERNTQRTLNPEQARCVDTLSAIQRPYNWPLISGGWHDAKFAPEPSEEDPYDDLPPILAPIYFGPTFLVARMHATFATYDFSELTALVVAAHNNAVRVEISAESYRWVDRDSYIQIYVDGKGEEISQWQEGGHWIDSDRHPVGPGSCLRVLLNARQREGSNWERHPTIEEVLNG